MAKNNRQKIPKGPAKGNRRQPSDISSNGLPRRSCPTWRALDVVGEKWSLLVVRTFVLCGVLRFQDLQQKLAGIAPNTLSARLKTLEKQGVIGRRFYVQHPPRSEYFLTEKGEDLRPIIMAIRHWGEAYT